MNFERPGRAPGALDVAAPAGPAGITLGDQHGEI